MFPSKDNSELVKIYENTILEYFIDNATAYYMTSDGKIHNVEYDHIQQIIDDFDLSGDMEKDFKKHTGKRPDWDRDWDMLVDFVKDFKRDNNILFLVLDLTNKILYVRGDKNDPLPNQKESLIDFCVSKRLELEYDPHAVA